MKPEEEVVDGVVTTESGIGTLSISSNEVSDGGVGTSDSSPMVSMAISEISSGSGMLVPVPEVADSTSDSGSLVVVACPPVVPVSLSDSGKLESIFGWGRCSRHVTFSGNYVRFLIRYNSAYTIPIKFRLVSFESGFPIL